MAENRRVLITGSEGFIGSALRRALTQEGYEVQGVDCANRSGSQVVKADLLDSAQTCQAIKACMPFSVLIHAAALAHGRPESPGDTCLRINTEMTKNILRAVAGLDVRLVFLSSVAVYGEDRRTAPVSTDDDLRPSTDYGMSKLQCEKLIRESGIRHCDILRLAPVYDREHMKDVRKRVYLPGPLRVKLRFWPSPCYSLCNVETVTQTVVRLLRQPAGGRVTQNVADPRPYRQSELLSWFPGRSLPVPLFLLQPLYYAMRLLPGRIRYPLRCVYWKLLRSNVYRISPQPE